MKALSLTQPWATLVAIGAKSIETRSWFTSHRGRIAIHAAKGFPGDCRELCLAEPFRSPLKASGIQKIGDLPRGAIIASATLLDCVRITEANAPPEPEYSFGNYEPGRFQWLLGDVTKLAAPIEAKGALGLWLVLAEIERRIVEAR